MLTAHVKNEPEPGQQHQETAFCSKFEHAIWDAGVCCQSLQCRMHEGRLFIHGEVRNYRQKQLAQEAVRNLPGVLEVANHLRISAS